MQSDPNYWKKMRLPSEVWVFPACFPSDDYAVIFFLKEPWRLGLELPTCCILMSLKSPPTHFLPVSLTTFKHPFPLSYLHFFLWCLWVTHFYSYQYFRVIFPFFQGQSLLQMYSRLHCCSPAANLQETTLRYQISESLWHWLVMACEEERSR